MSSFKKAKDTLKNFVDVPAGVKKRLVDVAIEVAGARADLDEVDQTVDSWTQLNHHVTSISAAVLKALPEESAMSKELSASIGDMIRVMTEIRDAYTQRILNTGAHRRLLNKAKDAADVERFRQECDDGLKVVKINLDNDRQRILARQLESVQSQHLNKAVRDTLDKLPYLQGASWKPRSGCMPETRDDMIRTIWDWCSAIEGHKTAEIFWLSGVAGSGKTTLGNSISQLAWDAGWLLSSIFFDRTSDERSKPDKVVTTLARDLAGQNERMAELIAGAIDEDASLLSADLTRQFEELVLPASRLCQRDRPYIIVIDALDEVSNDVEDRILDICVSALPQLPGNFRIVLMSRPDYKVNYALRHEPHILARPLEVRTEDAGLSVFVSRRLAELATKRRLGTDWPMNTQEKQLVAKSEGLFLWADVATAYLKNCIDPKKQLFEILSARRAPSMQRKMDIIYETVLQSCPWKEDPDFQKGYELYMGTVIAAKEALSVDDIAALHGVDVASVHATFERLASLVIGLEDGDKPLQLIHLSLHDYLTGSDCVPGEGHLSLQECGNRLAQPCIRLLNHFLSSNEVPDLVEFSNSGVQPGVYAPTWDPIPGSVYYACSFWLDHLLDIDQPGTDLITDVCTLLDNGGLKRLVSFAITLKVYRGLGGLAAWLSKYRPNTERLPCQLNLAGVDMWFTEVSYVLQEGGQWQAGLHAAEDHVAWVRYYMGDDKSRTLALGLQRVSYSLFALGWLEAALEASEEAVELYRHLTAERTVTSDAELARCLGHWSNTLFELGRYEEALEAVKEAVAVRRRLAEDRPSAFNADLANSLGNWSSTLSKLGRQEESLEAIERAVALYRQLAEARPAAFNANLAGSLHNWSTTLARLGRHKESLGTIGEAVDLYRGLAKDRPAAFNADLAKSLNNWSIRLSDLGRQEESLEAIEEAVALRRQLAEDRPAAFNPDLARSLNKWSNRLSDLGRYEESLEAVEEAVALRRRLAEDRSATFNANLAVSLNNWSSRLSILGCDEESLEAIEEAVALRRRLAKERPAAFNRDLARSLHHLSTVLLKLSRREEALKVIEEALALRRGLAEERRSVYTVELAHSLSVSSAILAELGRLQDAVQANNEAVSLWRGLVDEGWTKNNAVYVKKLKECFVSLSKAGLLVQALQMEDIASQLEKLAASAAGRG